jgi:hypothetical protein
MSIETNILASPLEGRHLVQEIKPDTNNIQAKRLLVQEYLPGSFNYRGLVLKYHKVVDPETGKNLGATLPELPTRPVTIQTSNVVERLTGLCFQLDFLTLEMLDSIIRSGGFYTLPIEPAQPFTPSPELVESLHLLLRLETSTILEQRIRELASLEEEVWKRYIILHKARNKAMVELLGKLPGLISDAVMRTWFIVTLNARMPTWVAEAQERRSQTFLYSQLNKA